MDVNFEDCGKNGEPSFDFAILDPLVAVCLSKSNPNLEILYADSCTQSISLLRRKKSNIKSIDNISQAKMISGNNGLLKIYANKKGIAKGKELIDITPVQVISQAHYESRRIDEDAIILSNVLNYADDSIYETIQTKKSYFSKSQFFEEMDNIKTEMPCTVMVAKKQTIERMPPGFTKAFLEKINSEDVHSIWISLFKYPVQFSAVNTLKEDLEKEEFSKFEKEKPQFEKIEVVDSL